MQKRYLDRFLVPKIRQKGHGNGDPRDLEKLSFLGQIAGCTGRGDTRDGFEAELNSYGQGGRVLGPVVGAFGEMSDDVKELANAVAEELSLVPTAIGRVLD